MPRIPTNPNSLEFDPQKNADWKPAPKGSWDVNKNKASEVEFDPQKNAGWEPAPKGSWDVNKKSSPRIPTTDNQITNSLVDSGQLPESQRENIPQEPAPNLNLDPVEIKNAASIVAQAKRAMEYLKEALDALKTGSKEKIKGQAHDQRPSPNAEQIGNAHASMVPPEHGGSGDMSATLENNISGYEAPPPLEQSTKGAGIRSTEELFGGLKDQIKSNNSFQQELIDSLDAQAR